MPTRKLHTINADTLHTYLPAYDMEKLPILNQTENKSMPFGNERELLYLVFEMKKEIDDLRATIAAMNRRDNQPATSAAVPATPVIYAKPDALAPITHTVQPVLGHLSHNIDKEEGEIVHEEAEYVPDEAVQTLPSLEDAEREMIRKSLERNNGKRKKTAEELGISERTLYRKIKEYNLSD